MKLNEGFSGISLRKCSILFSFITLINVVVNVVVNVFVVVAAVNKFDLFCVGVLFLNEFAVRRV